MTRVQEGIFGSITIHDQQGIKFYEKPIHSEKEIQEFKEKYGKSIPGWPLHYAVLVPLRTDSLNHLAKDLLLPSFINFTLTIHNVFLRVLAILPSIVLDVMTFPVRLIACPFRIRYRSDHSSNNLPILTLVKKSLTNSAIEEGIFEIRIDYRDVKTKGLETGSEHHSLLYPSILRKSHWESVKEEIHKIKLLIATKSLPGTYPSEKHTQLTCEYLAKDGMAV